MKNIEKDDECGQNNISFNIVTSHSQFLHSHEIGGGSTAPRLHGYLEFRNVKQGTLTFFQHSMYGK